jgi:4a-hydroxytetrahydrobiopterin dehydratase
MLDLVSRRCVPCEGGTPPLPREEAERLQTAVPRWDFDETGKAIRRAFKFKDFREAMAFVNAVADLAETEGHHPDIAIRYQRVTFTLTTHAIGGLSENDFILAAKIDRLHQARSPRAAAATTEP